MFYLPVGFFALLAAFGHQQPNGSKGALAKLGGTLLGDALLAVLAFGLAAFVLWQLVVAIADPGASRRAPQSPAPDGAAGASLERRVSLRVRG